MQQTNAQASVMRAQEGQAWRGQQLQGMGLEQQALNGMRGQDIGAMNDLNTTGLGYGNLGATYSGQATQSGEFGDDLRQRILGGQLSSEMQGYSANMGYQSQHDNQAPWWVKPGMATLGAIGGTLVAGPVGGAVGAEAGSAGADSISDIRAKKDIQPAQASPSLRQVFEPGSAAFPDRLYSPVDSSQMGMPSDAAPVMRDANGKLFWQTQKGYMPVGQDEAPYHQQPQADLRPAQAYSYKYKDPAAVGAGPGTYVGPMAQDLEKTPAGASTVVNTPKGKAIDTGRLSLVNSSAISETQKRQDELEQRIAALHSLLGGQGAQAWR